MFERLNGESHRALEEARAEAGRLGHDFVGTEHLLLGVLDLGEETASALLASKGVLSERVRAQVARAGALQQPPSGLPPLSLTARAKQVMALAGREADDLGSTNVAPAHLLLGIIRQGTGVAALVLQDLGVDLVALRDDLLAAITGGPEGAGEADRGHDRGDQSVGVDTAFDAGGEGDRDSGTARRFTAPACPRCERPLAEHLVVSEMSSQKPSPAEPSTPRLPRRGGRSTGAAVVVVSCGACGYPLSVSR